jgi:molecular chaperone GrpE
MMVSQEDRNHGLRPKNEDLMTGPELDERSATKAESLEGKLAEQREAIDGHIERLQRLQAEFDNYRKRVERDAVALEAQVVDRMLLEILPVYDNMQRAFANHNEGEDPAPFVEGMERIFAQFDQLLKQHGVTAIEAVDTPFDPELHEALLVAPSDRPKNVVVEEFERGYRRGDRVLRPSKVKVSQGGQERKEDRE